MRRPCCTPVVSSRIVPRFCALLVVSAVLGLSAKSTLPAAWAQAEALPPAIVQPLEQAERILVGSPEQAVAAGSDKRFVIIVDRALRGVGARGSRALIAPPAEGPGVPGYKPGTLYLFLLKKGPGGKGWALASTDLIALAGGKVRWTQADTPAIELETSRLEEEIDRTTRAAGSEIPARESFAGRWVVYFSERGTDVAPWLIECTPAGDEFQVRIVDAAIAESTLAQAQIAAGGFQLDFVTPEVRFEMRGRFDQGRVRGVITVVGRTVAPAWFVPTDAETLGNLKEPRPGVAVNEYRDALASEQPLPELLRLVRRFDRQPIALDAYQTLIPLATEQFDDSDRLALVCEASRLAGESWGPALAIRAQIDAALAITRSGKHSPLGLTLCDAAREQLSDATPPVWKTILDRIRGQLLIGAGRIDEGVAHLREIRKQTLFDPEITWLLSQQALQANRLEEARDLLGELVALPGMEGAIVSLVARKELEAKQTPPPELVPNQLLVKTWQRLGQPLPEIAPFLDRLYDERISALAGPANPPRDPSAGNRTLLIELFTGAQCAPCVGPDFAASALARIYPRSEVVVIRYHQHVPGADPLANSQGAERFKLYRGDATPLFILNGRRFEGVGGGLTVSTEVVRQVRTVIDPLLQATTPWTIELNAQAQGNTVELYAKAKAKEAAPESLRLQLALVERQIPLLARNGIRIHEMVVRSLPGGAAGIAPRDGSFTFQQKVDLAALRKTLLSGLAKAELEEQKEFPAKPVDLQKLALVGWLQDAETGEILQTASFDIPAGKADDAR